MRRDRPLVSARLHRRPIRLNDRMSASVNVVTGTLDVSVTDLVLPAIGGGLPLGWLYGSLTAGAGSST